MRQQKAKKNSPLLSILIPVYNEVENIQETVRQINKHSSLSSETLVVYDSKKDSTIPIVKKLQKKYKNLYLVKNNIKKGPSGALRTGIAQAKGSLVLITMADLCDDLSQIGRLLKLVPKKADIACPSRYSKGGKQELNAPFKVGLPKMAGFLLKLLTGIPTSDPTNSYKLYSAKLLKKMTLRSTVSFSVTLEIMAKAHCLGARIVEIPTTWKDRQHGKTNFKLWPSLVAYVPWFLFALLRNRLFRFPFKLIRPFI